MYRRVFSFLICLFFSAGYSRAAISMQSDESGGFISPTEVNVRIESDARMLIVMAAINAAGFDYEPGGMPLSPARAELRRELVVDEALRKRLAAYYKQQRRPEVDEGIDAVRYAALSLLMNPPPSFLLHVDEEDIPGDLISLKGFVPLVQEFYLKSNIKNLIPKYTAVCDVYVAAYRRPVGEQIFAVYDYLHARPETTVSMRPLIIGEENTGKRGKGTAKQTVVARNRTRTVYVLPSPFASLDVSVVRDDVLNRHDDSFYRRIGDDYVIILGPSRTPAVDTLRRALIRFTIDPIVEQHLKPALEYKDQIAKLVAGIPTADPAFATSVYLVLRESLARAAEVRLRSLDARRSGREYLQEEAIFDLAQSYLGGAALTFHFHESLIGFEKVGISISDFISRMVATTKFDREAARPAEFEPVVATVAEHRKATAASAREAGSGIATSRILVADDLIRQRRFGEARQALQEILAVEPVNARALFGMAQVISQTPSAVEMDESADENDRIDAQHERLEEAITLYRNAIAHAGPADRWLVQWSHVYVGRILDFQEFRNDALAEYDKAISMGEIPSGAYREALEGKRRPFTGR